MHPTQVLLEVVQSRPSLVRARAILPETEIGHLRATLGLFIMNALLVARKVVDSAEAFFARTVRLLTFEELSMPGLMFSKT